MGSEGPEKVDVKEARRQIGSGEAVAVDVRSKEEWTEAHVPGAIHLPDGDPGDEGEGPEDGARLIVVAKNGKLAGEAASKLSERGYEVVAVDGGMDDWISEGFNVQPTDDPDEDTELGRG